MIGAEREVADLVAAVVPAKRASPEAVQAHLDALTKPVGSLGRLEALALRLACIYGDPPPPLARRMVFVLAADHGVALRGVSAYPAAVTAQMCRNYASGGAAVSVLARASGASVVAVDIGVDADLANVSGIVHRKIRRGTRDLAEVPALTREEVCRAVLLGAELVEQAAPDVVALGEMGIGNTTAASALTAALTGTDGLRVVGPGTGVSGERLAAKRDAVRRALARIRPGADPLGLLAEVGGLEIAGLVGVTLGGARAGRAVLTDGFIATAAALVAVRVCAPARDYLFAAHRSPEPGHAVQLAALDLAPILDLGLRLGEGTGATLAVPILDAAGALLREMATFASAGVSRQDA